MLHKLKYSICSLIVILLVSCGGTSSSSSSGGGTQSGSLGFNFNGVLQVTKGSVQQIYLKLNNSSGVTNQKVLITATDPAIVNVSPSTCTLSSSAPNCAITISGLKNGSTSLKAAADGYSTLSLSTTVGNDPVYGYLGVESSLFLNGASMESGSPISIQYSTYAAVSGYYTINVTGGLLFSSGIQGNNYAVFNVTGNGPIVTNTSTKESQNQCSVSSQQPTCTLTFYVPESAISESLSLLAQISGAITSVNSYSSSTLIAVGNPNSYPGTIALSTQTTSAASPNNGSIPLNMSAPLFVDWNDVAISGSVNISLTSQNPSVVSFYNYSPGNNTNRNTSATASCVLQYPPVPGYGLSCGFGIRGLQSGSAQITATAVANNGQSYTISPLNLTVGAQASTIRAITFTNSSTESMAIGITSGGANAYVSPTQAAVIPGAPGANLKPGGGSECGPNNPLAACPIGSSCVQGGSAPQTSSVFYCFYDQSAPVCGANCTSNYQLAPGGTTTFNISGSSGESDPTGIIWSGNFFARTKCNPTTGVCENASCNGESGGLMCGAGTGGSPGVNTLAEATFQRGSVDFYDVSIINGINFAAAFGPTTVQPLQSNAFTCGTAGSPNAQSGGWSESNQTVGGLPPALWTSTPNANSFPATATVPSESATSFFRFVSYNESASTCTADSDCSGSNKCGYWIATSYNNLSGPNAINESTATYVKYCGKHIAWLTADSIFGLNQTGINLSGLPFNFTESWPNPVAGSPTFSVGNLQLCNNNSYSSYNGQPSPTSTYGNTLLACGGVSWNLESGGYVTRVAESVITVGPQWITNVLPTITWMKNLCPTCYTYPFDDMSSTFTCPTAASYTVTFSDLNN